MTLSSCGFDFYICTVAHIYCCLLVKCNLKLKKDKEIMLFTGKWMNLDVIISSKIARFGRQILHLSMDSQVY